MCYRNLTITLILALDLTQILNKYRLIYIIFPQYGRIILTITLILIQIIALLLNTFLQTYMHSWTLSCLHFYYQLFVILNTLLN